MTPVESFRWLLALVLVANWLCGFVATCAAGYGPDLRCVLRFADVVPTLVVRALDLFERSARRALRIRRRMELSIEPTTRKALGPFRRLPGLSGSRAVAPAEAMAEVVAESPVHRNAGETEAMLGELRTALAHWRNWSGRRRVAALELDRLAARGNYDTLREQAERLRAGVTDEDPDWNALFDRLNDVADDDPRAALRDRLRAYRRDAKLFAAAAWAAAASVQKERSAAGSEKLRQTLARDVEALDQVCRDALPRTTRAMASVRVRDFAGAVDHEDAAGCLVHACLWASRDLGFPFTIAIVEPLHEPSSSADDRVARIERLRSELSAASDFDDRWIAGTEPFLISFAPATSGRAYAGRLETRRAAWASAASTAQPSRRADDAFAGRVQATVGTPSADEDLFAFVDRLVEAHASIAGERPGHVAFLEGGAVTIVEPRVDAESSLELALSGASNPTLLGDAERPPITK